ncbi:MAG: translesion error-prone DNA polymerase V autoproteolytic subunit [Rickettsiaceae bacterium]|nr:translesion error-prone DNA polymerase V autoproteolytic subunit [Rickettsiaceae bacterium]
MNKFSRVTNMQSRGGRRDGSGRPKGIGKYSCQTKPIRVPVDMIEQIDIFIREAQFTKHMHNQDSSLVIEGSFAKHNSLNESLPGKVETYSIEYDQFEIPHSTYELPLYNSLVSAGFPSPADDNIERRLDLNQYLIPKPTSTFFVRVSGDSMIGAHIYAGDILIVDKSIEARHNKIVIAAVNSELTVKRLYKKNGTIKLVAENPNYPDLTIAAEQDLIIWGVVTSVIHQYV